MAHPVNTILEQVNAMPAPTWHRLSMNSASVDVPGSFSTTHQADIRCDLNLIGAPGSFEAALEELQVRVFGTPQAAYTLEMAEALIGRETSPVAQDDFNPLDITALSSFQARTAAVEATRSVACAFETGMGPVAESYLRGIGGTPVTLTTHPGERGAVASVRVPAVENAVNACALDVVVADGSELTLALTVANGDAGDADGEGGNNGRGDARVTAVIGSSVRAYVGRDAALRLVITQAADDDVIVLDDSGFVLDEGARLSVRQSVLGGGEAYTGLACDLRGADAKASVITRYIGDGAQERDFNYVMRHRGQRTASDMSANGVLAGRSLKTLRGTIDFVSGCAGAEGSEVENVLLANEKAVNRSVPVILCGEDDVAGNHGATIGSMNADQLFYLESRGLSPEGAEAMALRAAVENAYFEAPDDFARDAVMAFGRRRFTDFAENVA